MFSFVPVIDFARSDAANTAAYGVARWMRARPSSVVAAIPSAIRSMPSEHHANGT